MSALKSDLRLRNIGRNNKYAWRICERSACKHTIGPEGQILVLSRQEKAKTTRQNSINVRIKRNITKT